MPRYKLTIEYDGAPFFGWQVQETLPSVQGALEAAVKAMTGADLRVHGAGRTDAGVHARGQVAHVDIEKQLPQGRFRDGLNAHLRPHPVAVLEAEIVPDTFEAVLGDQAPLPLPHRQHSRQSRPRHRPRLARAAPARQ